MHKKYSKLLIVSLIGLVIFGYYSYFYNDMKSEAATSSSDEEPLTSSLGTTNPVAAPVVENNKATEDTAFLMKLASLRTIKVDSSLFTSKTFSSLVDNNIKLDQAPYGRVNPFAPTENAIVANKPTFVIKTGAASQITNKSAILSGSIEGVNSNNIYFEYGITDAMGKVTPKVIPSLVGNFSSLIIALDSKTTYYYRVAATINGAISYGEIMTFNTN